jgi:hypothetical protein
MLAYVALFRVDNYEVISEVSDSCGSEYEDCLLGSP